MRRILKQAAWTPLNIPRISEGEWHDFKAPAEAVALGAAVNTVPGKIRGINAVAGVAGVADTLNGRRCVLIATSQYYTADGMSSFLTGSDTPHTIFGVLQMNNLGAIARAIFAGSSASNSRFHSIQKQISNAYAISRRGDADGASVSAVTTTSPATGIAFVQIFNGTTVTLVEGLSLTQHLLASALDAGSATLDRFTYGCERGLTNTAFMTGRLCEYVTVPGAITDLNIAGAWMRYAASRWGTP